ncbi:MAG: PEGA domain-containing protein, partial [Myxococcales bacterium]|nr:PEGA domain-containing protein [Myxococcales bacterium]
GLSRGGLRVVAPPAGGAPCQTRPCQAQVARGAGAEHAIAMRVAVDRRDYAITIDVIDAEGTAVAQSAERCEVCGFDEAVQVVDSQAAALVARLDALALEPPMLVFQSDPPGAVIRVDEQIVGRTPFERVVEPGAHQVRADEDGYVSEQRTVEAVEGVRATVVFSLEPMPRPRRRGLRAAGWAALGIGVAGLATGVPLVVIDGRENRVSCSGENVDPLGNCKYLYATGEAGIAVTVVGAVALVTGVGIAIGTRRGRGAPATRRAARLRVGPRGVTVQGRF